MTSDLNIQRYVQRVIEAYLRLPHTPRRPRDHDQLLAVQLHQRGISIEIIETAFVMATLRRIQRPPDSPPLTPIRSLHYFLPVIDELLQSPPAPSYLRYLRREAAKYIPAVPADEGSKKIVFT